MEVPLWLWIIIYLITAPSFIVFHKKTEFEHYSEHRMLKFLIGFILLLSYFGSSIFIGVSLRVDLGWSYVISLLIGFALIIIPWLIVKKLLDGSIF